MVVRDDVVLPQAEAARERVHAEFIVVVTADGNPLGVLGERELDELGDLTGTLSSVADRFPALVVVGGDPDELTAAELLDLAELLGREGLRSVLVERDDQPVGVVPRAAVAAVLPLDLLDGVGVGDPDAPVPRYVCRKCAPPSFHLPRAGGQPPHCRRVLFHGAMETDA